MATIEKYTKKNGKITYHFQKRVKNPLTGKYKYYYGSWNNPDNLVGVRLKKALDRIVEEWENQVTKQKGYDIKDSKFHTIARQWLETILISKSRLHYLRSLEIVSKFNDYFGNIKFADITAFMVEGFFRELSNAEYVINSAVIKPEKAKDLDELAKQYGVRKISNEGNFSRPTLYYARKGQNIAWSSAEAICKRFNLKTNDYFDKVTTTNKYSNETKLKYQRTLSAIFNYAIRHEIVTKNYASKQYYLKDFFKPDVKDYTILTKKDLDNLINVLNTKPDEEINYTLPVYLLVTLGIRTCECCGLNWSDIDFENKVISIRRDRIYVPHEGMISSATKNKYSERDLHICDLLYEKLLIAKQRYNSLKENDPDFDTCGAVHCNINGKPASSELISFHLKRYLAEAGCPIVSNHRIRHSWITELMNNNVPATVVAKLAGHVNAETTLGVYAHYSKNADNSKEILNKIFATNIT